MKSSLNHALLVFRSEQRKYGARLIDVSPQPLVRGVLLIVPAIETVPIGNRLLGVLCRTACLHGLSHESLIMLFRAFIRIGTLDFFHRIIPGTIGPAGGGWRIVAHAGVAPYLRKHLRSVAPEIARVRPQFLVFIKILGGKEIDRQSGRMRSAGRQRAWRQSRHGASSARDRPNRAALPRATLALWRSAALAGGLPGLLRGSLRLRTDHGDRDDPNEEKAAVHDAP